MLRHERIEREREAASKARRAKPKAPKEPVELIVTLRLARPAEDTDADYIEFCKTIVEQSLAPGAHPLGGYYFDVKSVKTVR